MTRAQENGKGIRFPLMQGLLPFQWGQVPSEIIAGITLAALAIPEVMGYTKIAGTPVITGLYTMLIPMGLFAVFGSSRHLVVGADSATAAMLAATGMSVAVFLARRQALEQVGLATPMVEAVTVRDVLTGLVNRRGLELLATPILESARRQGDAAQRGVLGVAPPALLAEVARDPRRPHHAGGDRVHHDVVRCQLPCRHFRQRRDRRLVELGQRDRAGIFGERIAPPAGAATVGAGQPPGRTRAGIAHQSRGAGCSSAACAPRQARQAHG